MGYYQRIWLNIHRFFHHPQSSTLQAPSRKWILTMQPLLATPSNGLAWQLLGNWVTCSKSSGLSFVDKSSILFIALAKRQWNHICIYLCSCCWSGKRMAHWISYIEWSLLPDLISRITSRSGAATAKIWFPDSKSVYRRSPLTSSSLISREQRCIWILVFAWRESPKSPGCKLGCFCCSFSGLQNHLTLPDC